MFSPNYKSFIPIIFYSFNNKAILKNVKPKENISLFSGINSPKPYPKCNINNSGDI